MGSRSLIGKSVLVLGTLSSLAVLADNIKDLQRFSNSFMKTEEVILVGKFDESSTRGMASFGPSRPTLKFVGHDRAKDIDGKWQIVRVVDEKGSVLLDK